MTGQAKSCTIVGVVLLLCFQSLMNAVVSAFAGSLPVVPQRAQQKQQQKRFSSRTSKGCWGKQRFVLYTLLATPRTTSGTAGIRLQLQQEDSLDENASDDGNNSRADDIRNPSVGFGPNEDVSNRFKYKVNALMGVFDPSDTNADNERQDGNILNAMVTFPTVYTFHLVGKTTSSSDAAEIFVQQVQNIVATRSGNSVEELQCEVKPRGNKFTKVTVTATVDSAAIITAIYDDLQQIDNAVMRF